MSKSEVKSEFCKHGTHESHYCGSCNKELCDSLKKENEELKGKLEQLEGTCQNLFDLWQNSILREKELKIQVEILKEYKAIYEGLCK